MAGDSIVVLGGGTGGVVAARRLRRRLEPADRVVLVERDPTYRFAPSFLWVMTGARRPEQVTADLGRLRRRGIEVLEAEVLGIETGRQAVATTSGEVRYERLVISLGAELAPELLPGFSEGAHNVYTLEGAVSAGQALRDFTGGRVAVVVSRLPYKCPAAPYETALLAEAILRKHGVRARSSVHVYTPEPQPMPVAGPAVGRAVVALLETRSIGFHPEQSVERIEADGGRLVFAGGRQAEYDLLLGAPPHRSSRAVRESGLVGESGFLPVDREMLTTSAEGVFAIGDATAIEIGGGKLLPKAGVFAERQAEVVAARIAADLAGHAPTARFDGKGSCFLEAGGGAAGFASGDFYAEAGPEVVLRRPGRHWHLAKVALERYWLRRWLR